MIKQNLLIYDDGAILPPFNDDDIIKLNTLGLRNYELSNHLGNVLEVVTDRKLAIESTTTTGTVDYYTADVVTYSDYYPFGVQLPGRHSGSSETRYGFNGKEQDPEISGEGNSYDFGARMYNPRIARWSKVDNKAKLFPSISPYAFANNNPIYYIDSDGNVIEPADEKSKNDFNKTVANVMTGNAVATKLFTIAGEANSLSNISRADLSLALNATESIEQRAVIQTLYLAANSKTTYSLQSLPQSKQSNVVDYADGYQSRQDGDRVDIVVSLQEAIQDDQIGDAARNLESTYLTGRVNENRSSTGENGTTKRDGDAMLFAAIGASFMQYDSYMDSPQGSLFDYGGDIQLSAIQLENIVMRLKGKESLSGKDFQRPNGNKLGSPATNYVNSIPNQLEYSFCEFTSGMEIINNLLGTATKATKQNYDNIDKQDAP
jgi:RHS repeat-associated protein